jgi:hypothetical protein
MKTICQKALELLSTVPAEDFITDKFADNKGKCCAIGHFIRLTGENPADYSPDNCADWRGDQKDLRKASRTAAQQILDTSNDIDLADINNSPIYNGWIEESIKDRVIHFLQDAVKAGF